jgi:hypothetical protein
MALLRLLAADHPTLPAPHVHVSPIYPDLLTLSVHDDLAGFEAWREALGVDPDSVGRNVQSNGTTAVLKAVATIAEARVELVGYSPNIAALKSVA